MNHMICSICAARERKRKPVGLSFLINQQTITHPTLFGSRFGEHSRERVWFFLALGCSFGRRADKRCNEEARLVNWHTALLMIINKTARVPLHFSSRTKPLMRESSKHYATPKAASVFSFIHRLFIATRLKTSTAMLNKKSRRSKQTKVKSNWKAAALRDDDDRGTIAKRRLQSSRRGASWVCAKFFVVFSSSYCCSSADLFIFCQTLVFRATTERILV